MSVVGGDWGLIKCIMEFSWRDIKTLKPAVSPDCNLDQESPRYISKVLLHKSVCSFLACLEIETCRMVIDCRHFLGHLPV